MSEGVINLKKVAFVYSVDDIASINIKSRLEEELKARKVTYDYAFIEFQGELIYKGREELEILRDYDIAVFLSRHESESKRLTLSAHVPGNWTSDAKYGGEPLEICLAPAQILTSLIVNMHLEADRAGMLNKWDVTYEVTHHGPYVEGVPVVFAEIGSDCEAWRDQQAATVVARAVLYSLEAPATGVPAVGIGGPHYAPAFNRIVLKTKGQEVSIGHIIPSYVLKDMPLSMIKKAIEKTIPKAEVLVLDNKGLKSKYKKQIIQYAEQHGIQIIKV